ncbi:hypothetical protein KC218_24580, partial [Mycobacterium tuberculosis]|nr:hypothetical protein [Mycobacterium tuberculosis]
MRLPALLRLAALAMAFAGPPAAAETVALTDITGRTVTLDAPAKRVLVGEARQLQVIAALTGDHQPDGIVGWRDDLIAKDADSYAAYR